MAAQTIDIFDIIRSFVAGAVLLLMGRLMLRHWHQIKPLCRSGMGFVGAGIILTLTNSILGPGTPFQDWSFIMFLIGLGMMFYEFGCAICEGRASE